MTDKYKDLRDALDAGPKPGKWRWKQVGSFNTPGCAVLWPDTSKGGVHYRRIDSGGGMEQVDADFIAAANPEAIRALLAEREALREALQKVRPVIAADRQVLLDTHGDGTEIPATDELGRLGLYEYDGALHVIDAALAQHQGEKHGDQDN